MIFYEAPHKLIATLEDFLSVFGGERGLFIARELTKAHEEGNRTTVADALAHYRETPPRGEFVLVVDGAPEISSEDAADAFACGLDARAPGKWKQEYLYAMPRDMRRKRSALRVMPVYEALRPLELFGYRRLWTGGTVIN